MSLRFDNMTVPPKYKYPQDSKAEFYYLLLLPDPDSEACHIMRRVPGKPDSFSELWAFTDSQDKAQRICMALAADRTKEPK